MTINDQLCGFVHLRRVAECVSGIHDLPGIPTATWAQAAAECVSRVLPRCVCAVRLVELGSAGDIVARLSEGAFDADKREAIDCDELTIENETASEWWLSATPRASGSAFSRETGLLRSAPGCERWEFSTLGRRWASRGVTELLIGAIAVPAGAGPAALRQRWITVEIGDRRDPTGLNGADEAVLSAVLPEVARRAGVAFAALSDEAGAEPLTGREHEVLMLLAQGKTVKQIAEDLARSPHTVHDHVKALHRKLGASSRGELVARALGHIDPTGNVVPRTVTKDIDVNTYGRAVSA